MVATENGTRMTDSQMRDRVERIMERKLWSTNRAATELGCYESQLVAWLEDPTNTAFPMLRRKLHKFLETHADLAEAVASAPNPFVADGLAAPTPITPTTMTDQDAPDFVHGDDVEPGITGEFTEWILPAGFTLLAPSPREFAIRPAGITVAKNYDRAGLSRALFAELGNPERVLIAGNPVTRELVITRAERESAHAMRVTKGRDLSKSVARWVQEQGVAPGFYPVSDSADGDFVIQL